MPLEYPPYSDKFGLLPPTQLDVKPYHPPECVKQRIKERLAFLEAKLINNQYPELFNNYSIYFITLNPRIDATQWTKDINIITRKWQKKQFHSVIYNFEFKTKEKYRLHSHALVFLSKKAKRRVGLKYFTSKEGLMCRILGTKQHIDVKRVLCKETLGRYINYLVGNKVAEKTHYVDEDKRIRCEHFKPPLPNYIYHQNPAHYDFHLERTLSARLAEAVQGVTVTFY